MKNIDFSPVHLRTKKIAHGKESIYLDIVKDGVRRKEYLGLYLVPEQTRADKVINRATLKTAEEIKAKRLIELLEGKLTFAGKKAAKVNLIEWLEEQRLYYYDNDNMNYSKTIHNLIRHLELFNAKQVTLKEVTPAFLRKFLEYLRGDGANKYGGRLCQETIYTYFTILSILMNKAVRLDLIASNPFHKLSQAEKPQRRTKKKEYLTLDEVKRMSVAECDDWRVKYAFLFCCFTGLRYVDVSRLKWKHIVEVGKGEYQIELVQQKTKEPVYIPLSANALKWLPERGYDGKENYIFKFRDRSIIYDYLNKWAKTAGVEKHVTFHMSRHTCATLLLYYGTDLYTVSKILGHTSIKTTQVYAKVADEMKRKAVENVPEI
ncbi:MAG: site-specific integrase [Prevotella sp.]|nr:site-specific integrase [Prevotella sp.]